MPYKVFLVEDEVTTREGIRDNVDWRSAGFTLCGEAPDGEIALPQIEATQPDVLITDIKMPFMDGLQLCKIIREHWSWMKIVIISGHSDFQYAQAAIQLGATEYLLKPVSVEDLHTVLARVAALLDQEKSERNYLKQLSRQVEDSLQLQRDKFLLRLVIGGESSISAVTRSQELGLQILAPYYLVIVLAIHAPGATQPPAFDVCQQVEVLIAGAILSNPDVLFTKAGVDEFVLIFKGESLEQLSQESQFLADLICSEAANRLSIPLRAGIGAPQQRLGDLHRSYVDALMQMEALPVGEPSAKAQDGAIEKLDHAALLQFLERGTPDDFETFYRESLLPLAEAAQQSRLLKHYVLVDIALTAAQFVSDLGGDASEAMIARYDDDALIDGLATAEQLKEEIQQLVGKAWSYREKLVKNDRAAIVQQARSYIANRFADASLSLNDVAEQVNFSPNHFSAVFSEETGTTFRDYLTNMRIDQAKKLLHNAGLKCSEVAFQCGYNDSHYFSIIFRKKTGLTPQQYRNTLKS